jgi:two-component system, LytTR family, sensor histidine kinase LytS
MPQNGKEGAVNESDGMIMLLVNLLERLGIFAIVFILIMRFDLFKRLLTGNVSQYEKLSLSMLFGLFGIAGTYMGVPIQNAIANSRVIGVALGGILGGPMVGAAAGVIAGLHRFLIDIGGFTAVACGVATVVEGLAGGLIYHRLKRSPFDPVVAFITGIAVESLQMIILLIIPKPLQAAVNLVSVIGLPMILINSFGLALFVVMIASVYREQERFAASQAQTALKIASHTLPFLRSGLNLESASKTADIILAMTNLDAVAISDDTSILAYAGAENDHHRPGTPYIHASTRMVLATGQIASPLSRRDIGCTHATCRLGSAIIVPLIKQDRTIGTLQLFRLKENGITPLDRELADGLAHLFSNQLEISALYEQKKLVREAEIKALQAQINPHFLFNAINTIISTIRTDSEKAATLLVRLADFFRTNINPCTENVSLVTELEHCRAYIAIESARFEERVRTVYQIDEDLLDCRLPPLILQPLVENALKHGILPREEGGTVTILAKRDREVVRIEVGDDGVGMDAKKAASLLLDTACPATREGAGIALKNVNARLIAHFGTGLNVTSSSGNGTTISFEVPQP